MALDDPSFSSEQAHRSWLQAQAALPRGFRIGTATADFIAEETGGAANSTLTIIALNEPSPSFAACFTRNAFPGAPILVGRKRLASSHLSAVVINNKISNVCAPEGVARSESLCQAAADALGVPAAYVIPQAPALSAGDCLQQNSSASFRRPSTALRAPAFCRPLLVL